MATRPGNLTLPYEKVWARSPRTLTRVSPNFLTGGGASVTPSKKTFKSFSENLVNAVFSTL